MFKRRKQKWVQYKSKNLIIFITCVPITLLLLLLFSDKLVPKCEPNLTKTFSVSVVGLVSDSIYNELYRKTIEVYGMSPFRQLSKGVRCSSCSSTADIRNWIKLSGTFMTYCCSEGRKTKTYKNLQRLHECYRRGFECGLTEWDAQIRICCYFSTIAYIILCDIFLQLQVMQ